MRYRLAAILRAVLRLNKCEKTKVRERILEILNLKCYGRDFEFGLKHYNCRNVFCISNVNLGSNDKKNTIITAPAFMAP